MDEKKFPRNYSTSVVRVLEALSLTGDGKNIKVIGSASQRAIQFAGDYDANETTNMKPPALAEALARVIVRLKQIPKLVIGDIKCGEKNGEPLRWTPAQIIAGHRPDIGLETALELSGRTKIDTVAVVDGVRYVEISCVYQHGKTKEEPSVATLRRDLMTEIDEKIKDGDWWKALKRIFSIARIEDDNKRIERLLPIFNSDLGRLYSVISDINILIFLLENKQGNKTVMAEEIDGFRARLSNIWSLPEFIKAEPGFDKSLEKASARPTASIAILKRIETKFNAILQAKARKILQAELKHK